MDNLKVSIITVVYNGVKTIEQTIKSVLDQSYNNIEYLVIDGASTDGTQDIIEKYRSSISYFVSEKDEGLYDAMNKGIQHSTGDIIGIINSDDYYAPDVIHKVVHYFCKHDVGAVYGNTYVITKTGGIKQHSAENEIDKLWYYRADLNHEAIFIKKSVYDKFGLYDLHYSVAADYDRMLDFYSNHVKFGYIDAGLIYFRRGGLSQERKILYGKQMAEILDKYINRCDNKEEIMPRFYKTKSLINFEIDISKNPMLLQHLLDKYFQEQLSEIVIFGAGTFGEVCYNVLQKTEIKTAFFVDNNVGETEMLYGIEVKSPSFLEDTDRYILVAAKYSAEEIVSQLHSMGQTKFVTLDKLVEEFEKNGQAIIDC